LDWQAACKRLQIGGERGYGWGDIELVRLCEPEDNRLFGGAALFDDGYDYPVIRLSDANGGRMSPVTDILANTLFSMGSALLPGA